MSEESGQSLNQYRAQLEMIESALESDPDNADLLQLKADLSTLIQLMVEPEQGPSSGSGSVTEDLDKLEGLKVRALVSDREECAEYGNCVISSVEGDR